MATTVALMLTVCACSRAEPVVLASTVRPILPAEARQPCAPPVTTPARDLTAREVTTYWGRDRTALRTCEARRSSAVQAVDAIAVTTER